jgi:uncharacterized protein (DUF58 family)
MVAGLAALNDRFGRAVRAWAKRRQGIDPPDVQLQPRRIYILPTRAGLIFGLIAFVMLLGAMNYNNNLGFALTFLLAAIAIVSIHHCHHNLTHLRISAMGAEPVFAGERLRFRFVLHNDRDDMRWQLRLSWDGRKYERCTDLDIAGQRVVDMGLDADRRGLHPVPRLRVATCYPLGLFEAWSWLNLDLNGLAYPRPVTEPQGDLRTDQVKPGLDAAGDDDYFGMRQWRPGDSPRRMAWKAFARTGQKLVQEHRGGSGAPVWIDWDAATAIDTETRIAQLARQILDAHGAGVDFGLRIPGVTIVPDQGPEQRHRCLRALALLEPTGAVQRA